MKQRVLVSKPFAAPPHWELSPAPVDVRYVYDRQGEVPSRPVGLLCKVAESSGESFYYRWVPGTPEFPAGPGLPEARDHAQVRTFREALAAALPPAARVSEPRVFTAADPEPDVLPGALAVVHFGDYQRQEVWVLSGANIGNWYPLGGEHWVTWDRQRMPAGVTKQHPTWRDVVARGPVTLVVAVPEEGYRQGWRDGRAELARQVEALADEEAPAIPAVSRCPRCGLWAHRPVAHCIRFDRECAGRLHCRCWVKPGHRYDDPCGDVDPHREHEHIPRAIRLHCPGVQG